jgi:hypothetical protein
MKASYNNHLARHFDIDNWFELTIMKQGKYQLRQEAFSQVKLKLSNIALANQTEISCGLWIIFPKHVQINE